MPLLRVSIQYFQYIFNIFSIYFQYIFNIFSIYFQYIFNIFNIFNAVKPLVSHQTKYKIWF